MKAEQGTKKLRIITVDDSPLIAERLRTLLIEIEGVEFIGNAYNSAAALYLIQQERPHAVILDINLSASSQSSNGVDLLILLKEKYPRLKTIMLTNLTATFYKKVCADIGADYFFDKSNEFERIPEVIKSIRDGLGQNVEYS